MVTTGYRRARIARRGTSWGATRAVAAVITGTLAASAGAAPSDDIADAQKHAALVKAGPMTPAKAELLGKTVDFGPSCDTARGGGVLPTVYAPPCVQPFTGKNGGATSPGVTDKAVKVVVWVGDPAKDPVLAGQIIAAGASLDTNTIKATWQGYVDIYNQRPHVHGRDISTQ